MDSELKQHLLGMETRLNARIDQSETKLPNLDASLSGRMAVMEKRLLGVEMRLGGAGRN